MKKRDSRTNVLRLVSVSLALVMLMLLPGIGESQNQPVQKRTVAVDQEVTMKGVILSRDGEMFVIRDLSRTDTVVVLTDTTKIRTVRKGLFRGRKAFDVTVLMPGLILEVQGKGDSSGRLAAEVIQFTEADLKAAITASVRSAQTDEKLSMTDKKLAETRNSVVDTNKRISKLDEFDVVKTVTVLFAVNKADLSDEAKTQLNELAAKAPGAKNYTVEVQGYADPTGNAQKNLELSQRRADAVVQYLTVKHNIPLRRITVPMGYGATKVAGAEKAASGSAQERRVDVRILVNKGLNQ
jgi:outer membrane protein OmpA-like peptidoglycan-associated protein